MTRDSVLAILRQEENYISGEKISGMLGISRAAVNAAVRSLREDGYEILSSTNKGYHLIGVPNHINIGELMTCLPKGRTDRVQCLEKVNSTNKYLRDLAYDGAPHGQVVLADEQTDGKGRSGIGFYSPKGQGIYLSYLFLPNRPNCTDPKALISNANRISESFIYADYSDFPSWIAVSVSDAIEQVCRIRPQIGKVNDLLLNGKKICGILTELSIENETNQIQSVVIGIGINVTEKKTDFPKELRQKVSSLSAELKQPVSRAQLAAAVISALDQMYMDYPKKKKQYLSAYQKSHIFPT